MNEIRIILRELRRMSKPAKAAEHGRFFKTGPGQYGEGDRFRGITVPELRSLVRRHPDADWEQAARLLVSRWHEDRLLALFILVRLYRGGGPALRNKIHSLYLRQAGRGVNNWDLVDSSAEHLLGAHLWGRNESLLYRLAKSPNVWKRRMAMIATFYGIRRGEHGTALQLARGLRSDPHDLIHKAVGWMLREIGKRDLAAEKSFLDRHAATMPRTMLRYAVEKLPKRLKDRYMSARERVGG